MSDTKPEFPKGLSQTVASDVGDAVFGVNVLAELVRSLDEAAQRPRTERIWGPGVLGCAMWIDDPELLEVLGRMANVCVVVTKQTRRRYEQADTVALKSLAEEKGLAQRAFHELSEIAPRQDGRPVVLEVRRGMRT